MAIVKFERISHAHDGFFKTSMSNPKVARAFFANNLPDDIRAHCNLDVLELQPTSFIDDVRKEAIVDILYKTKIEDNDAYLYLIVEHQSTPDEFMSLRILKYTCNILEQTLQKHKSKKQKKRLPLIFPMVIYHGKKKYSHTNDIRQLIDAPFGLVDKYFLKPFKLIDLSQIEDEVLREQEWAGIMQLVLKHIFARDVLLLLREIAYDMHNIFQSGYDGQHFIGIVLQYVLERGDVKNTQDFFDLINNQIDTKAGEMVMTLAERLINEGEQKGRMEGRMEGLHEGLYKGRMEGSNEEKYKVAKNLLAAGADVNLIAKAVELPLSEVTNLIND